MHILINWILDMKISDDTYAEVLATNSSHHYVKCVDINPKSVPALVAVGLANGKVSLISFGPQDHLGLAGKEIGKRILYLFLKHLHSFLK